MALKNYFRGIDILRNDVDAILNQIIKSNFLKNKRHETEPPETESMINSDFNAWSSFNVTLFSDTHTLKIQFEYSSLGVAKDGNIKRAPGLS